MFEEIDKGVCAPKGFKASGVHCGIRKSRTKRDLSLIYSTNRAVCAAVYTTNLVKGAPLIVTKENIKDGYAQAIICNSGNANTCDKDGIEIANKTCKMLSEQLKIAQNDVVVASTGVIGERLNIEAIRLGIPALVSQLDTDGSQNASEGIMTTDTIKKEVSYKFDIDGVECRIGGIAKGSGMIHPNMATMLVFITTDVSISPTMLKSILRKDVQDTFNMVSVDGDTSTNDMVVVMANGQANNKKIAFRGDNYRTFAKALNLVTSSLCRMIAKDGEGATKFIECNVVGAKTEKCAKVVAKSIISSSLVKAAMFGCDANWGRILCAIGYSGAKVDINKIDVTFKSISGSIIVCKDGYGVEFSEDIAKQILSEKDIQIIVDLKSGTFSSTSWGCDLTYDYVKINGDYRT